MRSARWVLLILLVLASLPVLSLRGAGDSASGQELIPLPEGAIRRFGLGWINELAFSLDGQYLAIATSIGIELWDVETSRMVRFFSGHTGRVYSVAFSPDGRLLASGSRDGTILLWRVPQAEQAFFDVSNPSISSGTPEVGESVSITATVKNTGGSEGSQYIRLLIDDAEKDREWVTLSPGGSKTVRFRYTFYSRGSYTVKVASDDDHVSRTVEVIEPNRPPQASFTFSPAQPIVDRPVTFDASTSSDPDGHITLYEWDFGDGSAKNYGMTVTHIFARGGTYTVKLTVTDDGTSSSVEQGVKVLTSGGGGGPA